MFDTLSFQCLCFEEKETCTACKKDMKRKSARLGLLTIIIPAMRTHHESFRDKLQMRRSETPRGEGEAFILSEDRPISRFAVSDAVNHFAEDRGKEIERGRLQPPLSALSVARGVEPATRWPRTIIASVSWSCAAARKFLLHLASRRRRSLKLSQGGRAFSSRLDQGHKGSVILRSFSQHPSHDDAVLPKGGHPIISSIHSRWTRLSRISPVDETLRALREEGQSDRSHERGGGD